MKKLLITLTIMSIFMGVGCSSQTQVFSNGHQKVWWKCSNGHPSYQATLSNRSYGKGCPYCSSQRVL